MRILFAYHQPLSGGPAGQLCQTLATGLLARGGQAQLILVDGDSAASTGDGDPCPIRRVGLESSAGAGPLLPGFRGEPLAQVEFSALSDRELTGYRDTLRRALDLEVAQFDPQVIHAQHVWLWGQLALETGVPYLLSAWGADLPAARADRRLRDLAEQAADNAGRIVAADATLARAVSQEYPGAAERTVVAQASLSEYLPLYDAVLRERFGH